MFDAAKFIEASLPKLRAQVGEHDALIALSGGVDSSVTAALMNKAIGKHLKALLLATGFMRQDEPEQVKAMMKAAGITSQHNILEQIGIDTKTKFGFRLIEPLAQLYKDQVRLLGKELGLPAEVYSRQPFPGPGLMVRCIGEVREDKVAALSKSVAIVEKHVTGEDAQQYFAAIFDS